MNKRFLTVLLLIIGLSTVTAQDISYVRSQALSLCNASMKGRGYVGKGLSKAEAHIVAEYKRLGLTPLTDAGFSQAFTHPINTFPSKVKLSVSGKDLMPGVDFLVSSDARSVKGRFALHFIDPTASLEPKLLADGKNDWVVCIDVRGVKDEEIRRKASEKAQDWSYHRPVILLSNEKLTWSASTQQRTYPILYVKGFDIKPDDIIKLNIRAKHIAAFESANVAGAVLGTQYPDSFVYFTAHYDHLGMMGKQATFYGANDNASGTAFILSLAAHYKANPAPFTCVFIAFAGEEAGLLGSRYYVENPLLPLDRIGLLINLDLMGSGIDGIKIVNAKANPSVMDKLQAINDDNGYLPKIGSRGQAANSDHYYFAEAGVPAIFIYALGGSQAYHDIHDVGANLSFDEYEDIFRLITDYINQR
jgi:aminopeptidase YwaD